MSEVHRPFMLEALRLADQAAERGEVPVGAVVVHQGEVIARGYNLRETWNDPLAHAESIALRRAAQRLGSWRLEGCTVYVTLEPCAMCAGAMVLSRIERCVYGARDPKGGYLGSLGDLSNVPQLNHRFTVEAGIEEAACAEQLKGFFRSLRARRR